MSTQPTCCNCGLRNDAGRDFCASCGEYLRWGATAFAATARVAGAAGETIAASTSAQSTHEPAPPPPPPEPPPPAPAPPDAVIGIPAGPPPTGDASIVLTPAHPALGAAGVPAVEAGALLSFVATVRNEGEIAGDYDLAVLGLPEHWAGVVPAVAFGSGRGQSAQEVRIDIAPPRESRSTAGIWTFELVVRSRRTAAIAARAIAQFEVKPFPVWSVDVVPLVNSGRLKARYRTAVRNDGNADQDLWLIAVTDSDRVRARFRAGTLTLQAGEVAVDVLTLRSRFPRPLGRTTEHRVGVDALPEQPQTDEHQRGVKDKLVARAVAPPTARQVVFRQKPVIPLWLLAALLLAALAAYVVYALPPERASVPSIVGAADSFAAEKQLRRQGLELSQPVQRRVDPDAEAGSVIEQSPAAGTKVDAGAQVSIVVAGGASQVSVPRLRDLSRREAGARLRADGLVLGSTRPAGAPETFVVRSQIPAAGLSVGRGSTVRVFLHKPPPAKTEEAAARRKAADPQGRNLGVSPQPGASTRNAAKIAVPAPGGSPTLAVETDGRVLLFHPATGKQAGQIPDGEGSASELSYVPGAGQAVYRSDAGLVVAGLGTGARKRMLSSGPDVLERPSVAPNGTTIAVIRREREGDGDLCFGRIDRKDIGQRCLPDDGWDLTGRIAWRDDGRAVLVPGRSSRDPDVFGVRLYQTKTAYTTNPQLWSGRVASDVTTPGKGVIAAQYSPDGQRIAFVSNLASAQFEVVLGDAADLELVTPAATGARACDVTWRPDGKELAIVEADAACREPLGKVARFALGTPKQTTLVADEGRNPTYRPAR